MGNRLRIVVLFDKRYFWNKGADGSLSLFRVPGRAW